MMIHDVNQGVNTHKVRKRVGRGIGSGHGKTSGRGHKGAGSRSGHKNRLGFAGGQMVIMRRIAKRGFNNRQFALRVAEVNIGSLEGVFGAGTEVTPELLIEKKLAMGQFDVIKILGDGELKTKLNVKAHRFSASAAEKIKAAGGTVEIVLA